MGRPDVGEERIDQILDAFEVCVSERGLEGTTLQRVADEAGVARSLIRHYLGNRDAVLTAWVTRAIGRYGAQLDVLISSLPTRKRAAKMVDYLFLGDGTDADRVMDLVVASSARHDECRAMIAGFIERMIQTLSTELETSYPTARAAARLEVAGGIAALSMSAESLGHLGVRKRFTRTWKDAAHRLLATLE